MKRLNKLNILTIALIAAALLLVAGGVFAYNKFLDYQKSQGPVAEIDLAFDAEGPYTMIFPRQDGNAIVLKMRRVASFDAFAYSVAYTDKEGIQRGAGDLDTWIEIEKQQGEYEQEILFGTCSKNVCRYDEGVENGTLSLRFKKDNKIYNMRSLWHVQKPNTALGKLTSGDEHFTYNIDKEKNDLTLIRFVSTQDLVGVPKLPTGKKVVGKVYAVNTVVTQELKGGDISINLADLPPAESKMYQYKESDNKWQEIETAISGTDLSAKASSEGIFALLASDK